MKRIWLKNYRCFRDKQEARLAPLTLLVGDNSTGKTSFLAMVRALWDFAYGRRTPDFKEEPYDLGSFEDIAHYRGRRTGRLDSFEGAFEFLQDQTTTSDHDRHRINQYSVLFRNIAANPVPVQWRIGNSRRWIEEQLRNDFDVDIQVGTTRGSWKYSPPFSATFLDPSSGSILPFLNTKPFLLHLELAQRGMGFGNGHELVPLDSSPDISSEDLGDIQEIDKLRELAEPRFMMRRPYASAPVRSRPRRTYDPARSTRDPEGDHVPMYLADLYFRDNDSWEKMRISLQDFGRESGLFDEIAIRRLGNRESEPFQIQVRKFDGRSKGPSRNLIDVGYGVSQVLPVITELLRVDASDMFLLQQPEVHLHPSAQAALGSLFCDLAGPERQLIVETHSDHLMDRVRMDVRDGRRQVKPEDVSILYFERKNLDVRIHSLRLDKQGNVLDCPESYRRFFMEETKRSLGF